MSATDSPLSTYPISIECPVLWGDMDALGHVNNTVYLRWFESGRIAYFEALGIHGDWSEAKCGPILARATCDFRVPLAYPDHVRIRSTVKSIGNTSFVMGYRVESQAHDWRVAAEGEGVVVMFDYSKSVKAQLTPELRDRIVELEGTKPPSATSR